MERFVPQVSIALAKQVEENHRCRNLPREKPHPRRGWMNPELQSFEVEAPIPGNDDLAIEHAALGQLRTQGFEQFGKITVQRFLVSALDQDLIAIAENQR